MRLHCSEDAFFYWAMQYAGGVEVLEPASLRDRLRKSAQQMLAKYGADAENTSESEEKNA